MEIIMVAPDTADDYKTFIEILASKWTTLHHVALTGEMIKASAEFNSFLAGMKGKVRGSDWIDFANRFEACEKIYEEAWVKFKASNPTDWPSRELAIEKLDDAFQRSADSMRTIVEDARRYEERLGEHGDFADPA